MSEIWWDSTVSIHLAGYRLFFNNQEYNQRLQSSYEAYVVNQQENKRLCEKTTTLQQELMQMQISGLVQENGALQTKVLNTKATWSSSLWLYQESDGASNPSAG